MRIHTRKGISVRYLNHCWKNYYFRFPFRWYLHGYIGKSHHKRSVLPSLLRESTDRSTNSSVPVHRSRVWTPVFHGVWRFLCLSIGKSTLWCSLTQQVFSKCKAYAARGSKQWPWRWHIRRWSDFNLAKTMSEWIHVSYGRNRGHMSGTVVVWRTWVSPIYVIVNTSVKTTLSKIIV